jgi:hypothetical protein
MSADMHRTYGPKSRGGETVGPVPCGNLIIPCIALLILSDLLLCDFVFFVWLCNGILFYTFRSKSHLFSIFCNSASSRGSSVFKVIGYELGSCRLICGKGGIFLFPAAFRPSLCSTQTRIHWVQRLVSLGSIRRSFQLCLLCPHTRSSHGA